MSIKCVYKPSYPGEELDNFNEIQKHFGWSEKITAIKIGTWQTKHDIDDRYPSIEEMTEYEDKQYSIEQEMQQIKDQAIANGTFMKAPNGKPTNLTERQWLQVRTKAFKDWFGDWENDPKNASKVVDENGEPLVVYHSGEKNWTYNIFEKQKGYKANDFFYFSSDKNTALTYQKWNIDYIKRLYDNSPSKSIIYETLYFKESIKDENGKFIKNRTLSREEVDNLPIIEVYDELHDVYGKKVANAIIDINNKKYLNPSIEALLSIADTIDSVYDKEELIKYLNIIKEIKSKSSIDEVLTTAAFLNIRYNDSVTLDAEGNNWHEYDMYLGRKYDFNPEYYVYELNKNANGFIIENIKDSSSENDKRIGLSTTYAVKHSNQIKSATDNIGTFSRENDNIYTERDKVPSQHLLDERLNEILSNTKPSLKTKPEDLNKKRLDAVLAILESNNDYATIVNLLNSLSSSNDIKKRLSRVKIEIDDVTPENPTLQKAYKGRRAYYDATNKTIHINKNASYMNNDSSSVLLHEIMHAITLDLIKSNPEQAKELQKILDTYKKNQGRRNYDDEHALQEFIADIFSNKDLINELKEMKVTKKTSLWDKLVNFFNNLFSGTLFSNIKEDSLMAQASGELVKLLEMPVTEESKGYYFEGENSTAPLFKEESSTGYRERTIKNAKADATIALATDFTSAGERLTKKAVIDNGKRYIPVDTNNPEITDELVESIVNQLNEVNAKSLNIAGNGIYTLKGKYTQEQVDEYVYNLLNKVLNHPNLQTRIETIRSGGQTGYDEAGIKAAMRLGIRNGILAPKGWKFRDINGRDISDEQAFKARFNIQAKQSQQETTTEHPIDTHQEESPVNMSLDYKMRQDWNPQTINHRSIRIVQLFESVVDDLEKDLPDIEKLNSSSATRQYIITARYGSGNILNKVKEKIQNLYVDRDYVTETVHSIYSKEDWDTQEVVDKIDHICKQGQLMLEYFEPLCFEASAEIKRREGVSILTKDGEVVNTSKEMQMTDEEFMTKHEEGWFFEPHEQSMEDVIEAETVSILSNLYEVDKDGNYIKFDDLEEPLPIDFRMALVTVAKIVGNCTSDIQMIPAIKKAAGKFIWMNQILNNLLGVDTETSHLYDGITEEDARLKKQNLCSIFWKDMHKIFVLIEEQVIDDDGNIKCNILNKVEGSDALLKVFEDVCYSNKTLFSDDGKPYKTVYNSDGSFNQQVYDKLHEELAKSNLYYRLPLLDINQEDIDLVDRLLKAFGVDISKNNIAILLNKNDLTEQRIAKVNELTKILFGFYAPNKAQNQPLQSVIKNSDTTSIFDAFEVNYRTLADIFGDQSAGFEESQARLTVDNEQKSLFSRIYPNLISTIVNKLKNVDELSDINYRKRLERDYGNNWWFAPIKNKFRKGLIKDLYESEQDRRMLRVSTLKASNGVSYKQEIDAQAEETRLNQFENTSDETNNFREYSVPTFSDAGESYYMRLRYFDIKDNKKWNELLDRYCDVARQEIDRIRVVKARAKDKNIIPISGFDKFGDKFNYLPFLNDTLDFNEFNKLSDNPDEQHNYLKELITQGLEKEFEYYLSRYNSWQVNDLPKSKHTEDSKQRNGIINVIDTIIKNRSNNPITLEQNILINNIKNKLRRNTMTLGQFELLKQDIANILTSNIPDGQWKDSVLSKIASFTISTSNLDKLKDYFYNSFYANTQILNITMRDPAFLGSADKLQKRFKMFYSPVSTCYTCEYSYNDQGQIVLNTNKNNSLTKETEYSLVLQDDILKEAFSMENIETLIKNRVTDGYLNSTQAKEILKNFKNINRSDAQCYRTLPSWQICLNMIGKGYNKKMQQSIDRLSNGTWSYEDYHNVWEIFKPFVASYAKKPSGLENNDDFNEQFDTIETPIMHKNSEFLLLAMYSAMSGEIKNNWKLKALNEFMVKHGIDKVQFESAVKVGAQGLININECETPEQLTATLEAYTGLHNNDQAENGNKQVITAIPFNTWGISTAMPEHLLEHEESSMGTQMMKIIMEGLSEDPNKTVKIGNETKTYQQVLQLYQAIHVQNLKDSFEKVGKKFADNRELSEYLKNQILSQNKFSNDLLYHLELDKDGNFIHPIIDPMLRNQFDSLIASLIRNNVTKRFIRMGALPQVASYGFDDLQLRFADEHGNLLLTQKEFEENHNEDNPATISYYRSVDGKQEKVTITFDTWDKYHEYAKEHSNTIKYMEVLIPPFDNNFMSYINDAFIYKNDVKNKEGKVIHKSGEFNHELFNKSIDKKLLEGIGNRVPTETKHSMIPIYVKGFLPSQNSSCVVTPAEWIAISDSDNDGDKLYTYFYHSEIFFDQKKAKEEFAKHNKFTYMPKEKRDSIRVSSSEYMGEDYKKSNELDIMWDIVMRNYNNNTDYLKTLTTYGVKDNERYLKSTTDFSANNEDARYRELKEFIDQARSMVGRFTKIRPVMYHVNKLDRLEGESDSDYKQRCDIESIKDNSHEARNNKMLDLMIAILRTEDNSAQILIPGGFPIIKDVSDKMKKLKHIEDNACSLCNPAVRTTQQVNNMAGRNLIGIYANHRSVRPLLEMSKLVLNKNNRPNINNNRSLPRVNKNISWSLSAIKNNRGEFISDNISNFSGASVDNAKDPRLGHLGQNEITAPISMLLIHLGYTIEEVASFISQPSIVECVRNYILNGRKGFLIDIVRATRIELENKAKGHSHTTETIDGLPLSVLDDQIERNAIGIVQNADDCLIQARVLENLEKLLPASDALNQIINVTKADTQVGALKARSSENKIKIQKIQRLIERTKESKFPLVGADKLIPRILDDIDVENSQIPYVSGFRFWGIESIVGFSKKASMTFSNIADSVHNAALTKTDALTLNADTIDGLTDATISYIFSSLPLISGYNRDKRIRATVNILNDIKRKRLLDDNPLIRDLVANTKGNKYSKNYPFIRLNKNIRKNISAVDIYKGAWRSLIVNGNKELNTSYGTITQKDLSDLLFAYCFSVNGLSSGNGSFIHCFPESEIDSIEGYNDLVKRLENYETSDEIVTNILDQYIANNPQNSSLVHRIDTRKTNIKDFLKGSKVVPNTIIIENFNNNQFVRAEWESGGTEYYTYPYVYFTDEIGRRYLYKGYDIGRGKLIYKRMQVLGNTKNGFLEEYEIGKSAIMDQSNCIESVLKSNSNTILDSKLKNEFDIAVQQMSEKGDIVTQEDHELILNRLLGNENIKEKGLEDYESGTKDRTGMVLCL